MKLNILVIHGYVQSAETVANNTWPLREALADIADLHYADGPPMRCSPMSSSRPWWYLGRGLSHDPKAIQRWKDTVQWWSEVFSRNQYDGIIGLSQGAAMAALLISMLNKPGSVPGFRPNLKQPLKFAILCSGFISTSFEPHKNIYSIPKNLPTLHTVDFTDRIVVPQETIDLQRLFPDSILLKHGAGHSVPVHSDWPDLMRKFILKSSQPELTKNWVIKRSPVESHCGSNDALLGANYGNVKLNV